MPKVEQSFTVARPVTDVWAFFQRIPEVAACLPGAEMTGEPSPGVYTGRVSLKLGPFGASFDGEAKVAFDREARSGHVEGRGVDKRGGSRSRMVVDFALAEATPRATRVSVAADITLSGAISQFGRTGLIQETANILIGDFVARLEERLAPPATPAAALPPPPARLGVMHLVVQMLRAWFGRLTGSHAR